MQGTISQEIKKIKVSYKLLKCFESLNLIMDEKQGENFLRELESFSSQEK